jgi:hypothetical protein
MLVERDRLLRVNTGSHDGKVVERQLEIGIDRECQAVVGIRTLGSSLSLVDDPQVVVGVLVLGVITKRVW